MGQQNSTENFNANDNYALNETTTKHHIFGDVNALKETNSDAHYLVKTYSIDGDAQEAARREKVAALSHENLLKVHVLDEQKDRVRVVFDKVDNCIADEVRRRVKGREQPDYFPEPELWYLALSVIAPVAQLQRNGFSHGQLSSKTVTLSADGKVKVFDPVTILGAKSGLGKGDSDQIESLIRRRGYFSPLVMENLNEGSNVMEHNQYKSDVFSFGMVLLEAATLTDITHSCYMWSVLRINTKRLQELLALVRTRYSRHFYDLLVECLCLEECFRPDWVALEGRFLKTETPKIQLNNKYTIEPVSSESLENSFCPKDLGFEVAESVVVSPTMSPTSRLSPTNRLLESMIVPFEEMIIKPEFPNRLMADRKAKGSMFNSQPSITIPPRSLTCETNATNSVTNNHPDSAKLAPVVVVHRVLYQANEPSTPRAKEFSSPTPPPSSPMFPTPHSAMQQPNSACARRTSRVQTLPTRPNQQLFDSLKVSQVGPNYPVYYGGVAHPGNFNYNFMPRFGPQTIPIGSPLFYRNQTLY